MPISPSPARIAGAAVMVTGGCGFIGSHLVRRLLALGARRVVVLDSLRYGDRANLGDLTAVDLVRHTLGTDSATALAAALEGVEYLFHFAAEKHNQSKDDPARVLRSNIDGTYTLFDLAARAGVRKIVFASSLYAYGRMQAPPFREDELPQPHTIYGISKLCGEHLLRHAQAEHGVEFNALRYLFVYGPRQLSGMGYPSVIVKNFSRLLEGEAPTIYGDGMQQLDYVFVDDAVEAAVRALEASLSGEVFNVGSGEAISVNALIDHMIAVAGRTVAKRHEPPDWTAGTQRVGDISKARRLLAWEPRVSLRDGLTRTFAWVQQARRAVAP